MEYLAVESQTFSLDRGFRGFYNLYGRASQESGAELKQVSVQLASLLTTIKEFPYIRYAKDKGPTQRIATMVAEQLEELRRKSPEYSQGIKEPRGTLLILDRSVDALSPLIHDFYYQAMAYDLLEIHGEQYHYAYQNNAGAKEERDVLLNEYDKIWPTVRHMHIAETIDYVIDSFNDFLKNNKAAAIQKGKVADLKEMSEAVRAMPQYKELLAKYSLHIHISQELMNLFNRWGLEAIAQCEQVCGDECDFL
jgi:syntaxin-binding protein 1